MKIYPHKFSIAGLVLGIIFSIPVLAAWALAQIRIRPEKV